MPVPSDLKPRVRPLEAFPLEMDGQSWIGLHDPTGLSPAQTAVTPVTFFLITHFDGRHTIPDIQAAFVKRFGQTVSSSQIGQLVRQLDEALLLESPRFAQHYQAQVRAYLDDPVRPMREGALPPADVLESLLEQMIRPVRLAASGHLAGLVAPHLDYPRGLPCYATAYGTLASVVQGGSRPETIIVLGTNHSGTKNEPVATDRDFATPFGCVACDRETLCRLSRACGGDLTAGQFDHLHEHSIELQVTILARLLGAERFRIVPLLLPNACDPTCKASLDTVSDALSGLASQQDGSMLLIAGADLSHVGERFGDSRRIEPAWLKDIAASDAAALADLRSGRPEGFVEHLCRTDNATRICSTGSLYVLRRALSEATWQDLGYHQAGDPESGTCVTCMAAALWRQTGMAGKTGPMPTDLVPPG